MDVMWTATVLHRSCTTLLVIYGFAPGVSPSYSMPTYSSLLKKSICRWSKSENRVISLVNLRCRRVGARADPYDVRAVAVNKSTATKTKTITQESEKTLNESKSPASSVQQPRVVRCVTRARSSRCIGIKRTRARSQSVPLDGGIAVESRWPVS